MKSIKNTLSVALLAISMTSLGQPFRYINTVFDAVDTIKNIEFATAPWLNYKIDFLDPYSVHDGETKTEDRPLLMDIFMPKNDTIDKRPAILFMHGGAFLLGTRHNDDMVAFCDSFARHGYVTATIDYRIGMGADVTRLFGVPIGINIKKPSSKRALYRATQDSRAAVRFLKHNAETYGIDTTKIFMVGSSAGGFVCLNNLYLNPHEITPDILETPSPGSLDLIGIPGYGGRADAVVSMWGALENTNMIENDTTPVFLIHGKADDIVPFKKGVPLDGIIPDNPFVGINMPEAYGSYCIDTALTNRKIYHETYFAENKGHEIYGVDTGEFGENGPNQYWDTVHWRINSFFFDRIRPHADFEKEILDNIVSFTNNSSSDYIALWNFGDGLTSNEWHAIHTYELAGNYKISLTVCNELFACDTISQTINISTTDIAENISEKIKVFPNPVIDRIKIAGLNEPRDITIYDLAGNVRQKSKYKSQNFLYVGQLQMGIYFLEIQTGNESVLKKFVKLN